jgi:hypothetical protein
MLLSMIGKYRIEERRELKEKKCHKGESKGRGETG